MKTKNTLLLSAVMAFLFLFGSNNKVNAQAVDQGNSLVDVYYGFPNLFTTALKATYANSGTEEDVQIGGIGPVGGRYEYMVADKIGIGLEGNYTLSRVTYRENNYDYKVEVPRIRIMPRFSYHFGNSDAFDGYMGVAAGYNSTKYKFTTNDPDYTDESIENLFPVAFRLSVGGRYFFSDNIGAHMELGLGGGALLSGGLSFKF